MAFTDQQLAAKTRGIINALTRLSAKERERQPTEKFAEDYNALLALVLEAKPQLQGIVPPRVEYLEGGMGVRYCDSRYGEIEAYCEQIVGLIGS